MKNSCHCSGRAESVNKASLALPPPMSALPLVMVTRTVLDEPADLIPKVAGLVMASEVVKALS